MDANPRHYVPIDLSEWCNAGVEVFESASYDSGGTWLGPEQGAEPEVGRCHLRGIPFQIGPDDDAPQAARYIGFLALPLNPVRIPIEQHAHRLIFAHTLLSTDMWSAGDLPGSEVASYLIEYEDGSDERLRVRERFEIGHFPQPWGHPPFLALPDNYEAVEPLQEGRWDRVGFRLTEVGTPLTRAYHLWSWRNPRPDLRIAAVKLEPSKPGFIVAGLTLSLVDEEPLRLPPRSPVLLRGVADPDLDDPLTARLDRGVATNVHTCVGLPGPADIPGFGRDGSTNQYTFIAAIPSATVQVEQGDTRLGSARWSELGSGPVEMGSGLMQVEPQGKNWVHVTVRDESGRSVACRVTFTSAAGIPYPPHGHHAPVLGGLRAWNLNMGGDVYLGDVSYAYIDGTCQGWLPRGRVFVEVARGFEYEPLGVEVNIARGQRHLDLTINRWTDMNSQGWYSGDTHVHFLSPNGALTEAGGEDLNVVNLLQAQWGHLFTNVEDFDGRTQASSDGRTLVHVSQENRQHVLGHLNLLGLVKPVMPMSSDGPAEAELGGSLDITTSRWADQAHEQGATVVVAHMPVPNGETAVLIATGRADALEMIDFNHFEHLEYYRYLNGGYRLPLVAGTDKMDATVPVGEYRTYARVEGELTLDNWLASVRAGRTFATSGPMLSFTVDEAEPGGVLTRPLGARVTVRALARSILPIHTLQVVQGGEAVAEVSSAAGERTLRLEEEVVVSAHGWLAARCAGPGYGPGARHWDQARRPVMAHTSPVYIEIGTSRPLQGETDRYLLTLVEGGLEYVQSSLHLNSDQVTYNHHYADHSAYLAEPFLEAQATLASRIAEWDKS